MTETTPLTETTPRIRSLGVLTSGGDAQGMNAAVRAVVRQALNRGVSVYAIYEGFQGMVDGGDRIRPMTWDSVGGILHRGGTVIGTARCQAFRERDGRRIAAKNLLERGIDTLVVIGGDGSLTGANLFRQEWPELLRDLVAAGEITEHQAAAHPRLQIAGLVGSIDNDMCGTDMTIGADSALHRIMDAVDAISSTADSHQRTFVVEVMGRNCGYLALMSALATGAAWVIIPESPPSSEHWEDEMCELIRAGQDAGRRDNIVIVAEGARDRRGEPIGSQYVKSVIEQRLGLDTRVTILGHVQRGGSPSAFDRCMSTLLGSAAVDYVLDAEAHAEPQLIGLREHRVQFVPLMDAVRQTHTITDRLREQAFDEAMRLRGGSFTEAFHTFQTLSQAFPRPPKLDQRRLRLAVLNASGSAPGMNTATRAAVMLGVDQGHRMLGVRNGFNGLIHGKIEGMGWMSVEGWASRGGSELGTNRRRPADSDFFAIARTLENFEIDGLLIIGGWAGYEAAHQLYQKRGDFPTFNIPIVCLPASINNNLPGTEFCIGADTALNSIVQVVDKIKQSAVASQRAFVVEVMGRYCGYLALLGGIATGAERVYLHEEGITLRDLQVDVDQLVHGFEGGKRLGLTIRNERANAIYTTDFICDLFEEEGGDLFEVRKAILGHLQQGGDPSPFDRIQATRLAARCVAYLIENALAGDPAAAYIGVESGQVRFHDLADLLKAMDPAFQRPRQQWWLNLRPIARAMAQPTPSAA